MVECWAFNWRIMNTARREGFPAGLCFCLLALGLVGGGGGGGFLEGLAGGWVYFEGAG